MPAVKGLAARSRDDEAANPELLEQLTSVAQWAVLVVGIVAVLYAAVLLLLGPFALGAWMSLPEAERERRVQARIDRIERALDRLGYAPRTWGTNRRPQMNAAGDHAPRRRLRQVEQTSQIVWANLLTR